MENPIAENLDNVRMQRLEEAVRTYMQQANQNFDEEDVEIVLAEIRGIANMHPRQRRNMGTFIMREIIRIQRMLQRRLAADAEPHNYQLEMNMDLHREFHLPAEFREMLGPVDANRFFTAVNNLRNYILVHGTRTLDNYELTQRILTEGPPDRPRFDPAQARQRLERIAREAHAIWLGQNNHFVNAFDPGEDDEDEDDDDDDGDDGDEDDIEVITIDDSDSDRDPDPGPDPDRVPDRVPDPGPDPGPDPDRVPDRVPNRNWDRDPDLENRFDFIAPHFGVELDPARNSDASGEEEEEEERPPLVGLALVRRRRYLAAVEAEMRMPPAQRLRHDERRRARENALRMHENEERARREAVRMEERRRAAEAIEQELLIVEEGARQNMQENEDENQEEDEENDSDFDDQEEREVEDGEEHDNIWADNSDNESEGSDRNDDFEDRDSDGEDEEVNRMIMVFRGDAEEEEEQDSDVEDEEDFEQEIERFELARAELFERPENFREDLREMGEDIDRMRDDIIDDGINQDERVLPQRPLQEMREELEREAPELLRVFNIVDHEPLEENPVAEHMEPHIFDEDVNWHEIMEEQLPMEDVFEPEAVHDMLVDDDEDDDDPEIGHQLQNMIDEYDDNIERLSRKRKAPESEMLFLPKIGKHNYRAWKIKDVSRWAGRFLTTKTQMDILRSQKFDGTQLFEFLESAEKWKEVGMPFGMFIQLKSNMNRVVNASNGFNYPETESEGEEEEEEEEEYVGNGEEVGNDDGEGNLQAVQE